MKKRDLLVIFCLVTSYFYLIKEVNIESLIWWSTALLIILFSKD